MRKFIAVALLSALALLSGCAQGWTADGRSVQGFLWPMDDAGAGAVAETAGVVGGTVGGVFGPAGAIAGEYIAKAAVLAVLGLFGYSQGRHRGWDEREAAAEPRSRGDPRGRVPLGDRVDGAPQATTSTTQTVTAAAN